MMTGLFANALGWRRVERERHQGLQDRMVFAARIDREPAGGVRMTISERGNQQYGTELDNPRRSGRARRRGPIRITCGGGDYYADMRVTVALLLEPGEDAPTLDELAAALQEPARPLFIGRKPCLPSAPLFGGFAEGDTALAALLDNASEDDAAGEDGSRRLLWPDGEGVGGISPNRTYLLTDSAIGCPACTAVDGRCAKE